MRINFGKQTFELFVQWARESKTMLIVNFTALGFYSSLQLLLSLVNMWHVIICRWKQFCYRSCSVVPWSILTAACRKKYLLDAQRHKAKLCKKQGHRHDNDNQLTIRPNRSWMAVGSGSVLCVGTKSAALF